MIQMLCTAQYSPKLGQFLSHDPLEYLDSPNLYAFGARDPVNGWDPMGLGTQGFANEFLDGVGRGAKKEYNRHVEEMSKSFDSMADTAKELKENWRFAFDLDVWKDTALDSGATVKELTKETLKEGQECAANAGRCLADSAIAKEARGLAEDIRRGDGGALGERVGKVGVNVSIEGAKAQATRGGGKVVTTAARRLSRAPRGRGNKRCKGRRCRDDGECFVAGTLILGEEPRPIEEMEPGEPVQVAPGLLLALSPPPPPGRHWHQLSPQAKMLVHDGQVVELALLCEGLTPAQKRAYQGLVGSSYVVGDLHATDVTPPLWRRVDALLQRPEGDVARIALIRPLWWLERTGARPGAQVLLQAKEAGLTGRATILSVRDEVSVDSRHLKPHTALVLGTIRHEDARILELVLEGEESAPLGVTPAHPLYSADRGQWVPAGEVQVGERLWTHHGSIATVTEVLDERRRETVYNLEVHRAQSYFVGPQRLLAHNTDLDDCNITVQRNA